MSDWPRIPDWVADFESYRRWAHSPEYPNKGSLSFLNGEIWIDMTREEFFTHNQVRVAYSLGMFSADPERKRGEFIGLGMFLTNRSANLATEPDGMYSKWSTMKSGRLQLTAPRNDDYMELTGTPDVVLEVVSAASEPRDKGVLKSLYWKAGIAEYWLVDAHTDRPSSTSCGTPSRDTSPRRRLTVGCAPTCWAANSAW